MLRSIRLGLLSASLLLGSAAHASTAVVGVASGEGALFPYASFIVVTRVISEPVHFGDCTESDRVLYEAVVVVPGAGAHRTWVFFVEDEPTATTRLRDLVPVGSCAGGAYDFYEGTIQ